MAEKRLKPGWQVWRFEQMAQMVNDRIDNPSEAGSDYYVGLEHLDSDSLKIRRWGKPTDVEATKLRFRKGDIIFGRRRAYQRKLAVAEFDGICSAHAIVLRARPDVASPQFLPFFMQSDLFMNRALAISVGSLSPTINWKTLAAQEFALPPINAQLTMTEALTATYEAYEAYFKALNCAITLCQSHQNAVVGRLVRTTTTHAPIGEVITRSPEGGCSAVPVDRDTGHLVLSLSALTNSGYRRGEYKSVEPTENMLAACLHKGDLLISRSNTIDRVGFVGIFDETRTDVSFPDTMMRLKPKDGVILGEYLQAILQSPWGRRAITRIAAGTSGSMKKINRENLLNIRIPVPAIGSQESVVSEIRAVQRGATSLRTRLESIHQVHAKLADNAFGESK